MCGIAGFAAHHASGVLEAMLDNLTHRGPDDRGSCEPERGIRLGMTRLAIIDLKTGHQPMSEPGGGVTLVFNGEIYNYIELRTAFEKEGRVFHTKSDTETILQAYLKYGEDFANHLNGMFAIAIWDPSKKKLILTRDRYGVKPLFYAHRGSDLAFASEIKGLKPVPDISWDRDRQALSYYLSLRHIPAPWTAYVGVRAMKPGEQIIWENGCVRHRQWYDLPLTSPMAGESDESRLTDELDELLRDSVRIRMRSDAAYGAYLSGGIDSSLITAMMSEFSSKPVQTFNLTYVNAPSHKRDAEFARMVAARYGTDHHEWAMDWTDLKNDFAAVMRQLDQPFAGVTSSYWLSRRMADHVKVALSGDGADEVFGSYGHHRLVVTLEALRLAKQEGRAAQESDYGFFAGRKDFVDQQRGLKPSEWRLAYAAFTDEERKKLLTAKGRDCFGGRSGSEYLENAFLEVPSSLDPLNRMLAVDVKTLLPNEILYFNDILSMAHGLEVRTPFLDYRIVEFGFRVPGALKIRGGVLKYLLRKVAARYLPQEILDRPKEGFVLPNNSWLRGPMRHELIRRINPETLAQSGVFNLDTVTRLLDRFIQGDDSVTFKVWTLFVLQFWLVDEWSSA
jgi:asparagine synthase (glutamine-hydrolysing)